MWVTVALVPGTATHAIDRYVGQCIRARRIELGLTQDALAARIGVSFQQLQKYERATNRVSASMLWEIARALDTTVGDFFEGFSEASTPVAVRKPKSRPLSAVETSTLMATFAEIGDKTIREQVIRLVEAIAGGHSRRS